MAYARRRGRRAQERRGSSLVAHACLAAECGSPVTRRITERPTSSPVLSSNAPAVRINAEPPVSVSFFSLGDGLYYDLVRAPITVALLLLGRSVAGDVVDVSEGG